MTRRMTRFITITLIALLGVCAVGLAQVGTWTQKADMPTPRAGLATSVVNGKIYAIGGATDVSAGGRPFSTVEVYDPATDTWTQKADMPTARRSLPAAVVNEIIYVIGGSVPFGNRESLPIVEAYDPATDKYLDRENAHTNTQIWGSHQRSEWKDLCHRGCKHY